MKQKIVAAVVQGMLPYLNNAQTEKLQEVLLHTLWDYDISVSDGKAERQEQDLLSLFLAAKRIEGCSEKSLKYYQATTQAMLDGIGKPIKEIVTEDIRQYLTNYQRERRIISLKVRCAGYTRSKQRQISRKPTPTKPLS